MANTDQIFFASPEPLPQAGHTAAAAMRRPELDLRSGTFPDMEVPRARRRDMTPFGLSTAEGAGILWPDWDGKRSRGPALAARGRR